MKLQVNEEIALHEWFLKASPGGAGSAKVDAAGRAIVPPAGNYAPPFI